MASETQNANSGANDTSVGAVSWFNVTDIASDNGMTADVNLDMGQQSHYLAATNYGFAIPSGATINGIVVLYDRKADSSFAVYDGSVKLIKGGTVSGNEKADGLTPWSPGGEQVTRGGSSDLWGLTLTDSDVNASNFGVAISAINNDLWSATVARLDYVEITVYYTGGGGGGGAASGGEGVVRSVSRRVRVRRQVQQPNGPIIVSAAASTTGGEVLAVRPTSAVARRQATHTAAAVFGSSTANLGPVLVDVVFVGPSLAARGRRYLPGSFVAYVASSEPAACECPPGSLAVVGAHGAFAVVALDNALGPGQSAGSGSVDVVGANGAFKVVEICVC